MIGGLAAMSAIIIELAVAVIFDWLRNPSSILNFLNFDYCQINVRLATQVIHFWEIVSKPNK